MKKYWKLIVLGVIVLSLVLLPSVFIQASPTTAYSALYLGGWTESVSSSFPPGAGSGAFANQTYSKVGQVYTGGYYFTYRAVEYFDTSYIPDDATIVSAKLQLSGLAGNPVSDYNIVLQNFTGTNTLSPSQFSSSLYSGNGGSLNTASWDTANWNTIQLNSTGLGWINKTGTTKLGLRSSWDIVGTRPIGWQDIVWKSPRWSDSTLGPKLLVEYSTIGTIVQLEYPGNVVAGTEYRIIVLVQPDRPIAGMQTNFNYDSSYFSIVDVKEGTLFPQGGQSLFSKGKVIVGGLTDMMGLTVGADSYAAMPANFADITVKALKSGTPAACSLTNIVVGTPEGTAVPVDYRVVVR